MLLQALHALDSAATILDFAPGRGRIPDTKRVRAELANAFSSHVETELAHGLSDSHPYYDVPGLLFSFAGLVRLDPERIDDPMTEPVLGAVTRAQRDDGCWSEGTAIVFSPGGDVMQQSSMEIALELAQLVRTSEALVGVAPDFETTIGPIHSAVGRTLDFCSRTYHPSCGEQGMFSGWSSDRSRWPGVAETWISGIVARLAHEAWYIERARQRQHLLQGFSIHAIPPRLDPMDLEAFQDSVIEPDGALLPVKTVWQHFIDPIRERHKWGAARPPEGGRSFILAGPPGSGKTYFVKRLANGIGWPVVTLGPGTFITRGLERIEETASQVFADLMLLENAVILLDECDELFRNRDSEAVGAHRSILSFATASMLPKLQDLYDHGSVITVLATNYLHRIDPAIRRPGRFDRRILFDRPDNDARLLFARRVLRLSEREGSLLAERSIGCSFKDLVDMNLGAGLEETSASDYAMWVASHGVSELQACNPSRSARTLVAERWLAVLDHLGGALESDVLDKVQAELHKIQADRI